MGQSEAKALALLLLAGTASAVTVPEVLELPGDMLSARAQVAVTGTVTYVFRWEHPSFLLADPGDTAGPALYVDVTLAGRERMKVRGADRLRPGDRVVVRGLAQHMLLEPGIAGIEAEVLGHDGLRQPVSCRAREVLNGQMNNRRVRVEGVFWGCRTERTAAETVSEFRLGTEAGPLAVRIVGEHPGFVRLRNRKVRVDGVVVPLANSRGEFIGASLEAFSPESIVPLDEAAPPAIDVSDSWRGVLAWKPVSRDGYLRQLEGEVIYRDCGESFFLVARRCEGPSNPLTTTRVNFPGIERLPEVGEWVVAEGFPAMSEGFGQLEEGRIRQRLPKRDGLAPYRIPPEELLLILTHRTEAGDDYSYRFVRFTGRIAQVEKSADGTVVLRLDVGGYTIPAVLRGAPDFDAGAFIDRPLLTVTGALDAELVRNGRVMTIGGTRLLLRDAGDVAVDFDAEAKRRRYGRWARNAALGLLVPVSAVLIGFILHGWRRRVQNDAVTADRQRIAENLHDALSQQLAGARMMIHSVKVREDLAPEARETLETAAGVLESARRDVRGAVLQLKDAEFSLKSPETLIRENVANLNARGKVRARVKLEAFPPWISGDAKSDLVAIVHEAETNAIRHGHARRIVVLAERTEKGTFALSVLNDGLPFDSTRALGPESGHFGISGMRERAERGGFSLSIGRRGKWTEVRLETSAL